MSAKVTHLLLKKQIKNPVTLPKRFNEFTLNERFTISFHLINFLKDKAGIILPLEIASCALEIVNPFIKNGSFSSLDYSRLKNEILYFTENRLNEFLPELPQLNFIV